MNKEKLSLHSLHLFPIGGDTYCYTPNYEKCSVEHQQNQSATQVTRKQAVLSHICSMLTGVTPRW